MAGRVNHIWILFALGGVLAAQPPYAVGDMVADFTSSICANESGTFRLYDHYGAENGGDNRVIWLNFFASW